MRRDPSLFLDDMLQAIEAIERYVQDMSFDEFYQDRKTVDAVVRNLEVLGEAAKNIPDDVRTSYPQVPWKEMAGMRDKLIHEYLGVNQKLYGRPSKYVFLK